MYHCCASNILQRIKTVIEIWWYNPLFFKLCFRAKCNWKSKMYIVVIWLSLYSSFFFLFTFQCFYSVCLLLFLMFSTLHPITMKTIILSKSTQIWCYYEIIMSIGKKNIDFRLYIVALYVKALRPYPEHLEISYCICNVHKATVM